MIKVSVIIPTYNRSEVILKTIESVLSQSFKDWECLVVDDLSTDDTAITVDRISNKDQRVKYLRNKRGKGACGARNTGLYEAKGDFVIFFDCDDYMSPDLIESLYNKMNEAIDVVTCWTNIVDVKTAQKVGEHHYVAEGKVYQKILSGKVYVNTDCALIRRKKCIEVGGWNEECPSYQEWDFHLRLSRRALYTTIKRELVVYYVGGHDTISRNAEKAIKGRLYLLKKYKTDYIKAAPLSYYKNLYDIFHRIKMFKCLYEAKSCEKIVTLYNDSIGKYNRLFVRITYPFVKILRKW